MPGGTLLSHDVLGRCVQSLSVPSSAAARLAPVHRYPPAPPPALRPDCVVTVFSSAFSAAISSTTGEEADDNENIRSQYQGHQVNHSTSVHDERRAYF
jgi:hypothetical protein